MSSIISGLPEVFLKQDFDLSNIEIFKDVINSIDEPEETEDITHHHEDSALAQADGTPKELSKARLKGLQRSFTDHLDVIEDKLSTRFSKRSDDFFEAMSTMHSVLDELSSAKDSVTNLRRRCSTLSRSLKVPNKTIHLNNLRNNAQSVLDKLIEIGKLYKIYLDIELLLSASDFVGALDLIARLRLKIQDFEGIDCLKNLESSLINSLGCVWEKAKFKISPMIINHDFSGYRFDEFVKVLEIVDLITRVGQEFDNPSTNVLLNCIISQASDFFDAYHKSSMDEQKMFLENELWEMLPVKNDFKLVNLKEFHFLRVADSVAHQKALKLMSMHQFVSPCSEFSDKEQLFSIPFERGHGCEDLFDSSRNDDPLFQQDAPVIFDKISLSSDSDDDDENTNIELNKDFVEEDEFVSSDEEITVRRENTNVLDVNRIKQSQPASSSSSNRFCLTRSTGPVLTNSSLNILRLFGRYIQIMIVLEPLSYRILMRLYNLLDYYTMIVYRNFGPDSYKNDNNDEFSPRLKLVVKSIRASLVSTARPNSSMSSNLISSENSSAIQSNSADVVVQGEPSISDIMTEDFISSPQSNNLDPKKAVAVESLIYLVNQLWNLHEFLESLIPANTRPQLREQFSKNQSEVPDFLKARAEMNSNLSFNFTHPANMN